MSINLWNVLHDGVVQRVEGDAPGDLSLTIEIGYLRKLFRDGGDSVIVRLLGCTKFCYQPELPFEMLEGAAAAGELIDEGVLGAEDGGGLVRVYCMNGSLYVAYKDFSLALDTGRPTTLDELMEKSRLYWGNFGKRGDNGGNDSGG